MNIRQGHHYDRIFQNSTSRYNSDVHTTSTGTSGTAVKSAMLTKSEKEAEKVGNARKVRKPENWAKPASK